MAVEIVYIIDRSGSMQGKEKDVIGGFNSFLINQQEQEGEARLTTVLFDDKYEFLHDGLNIKDIKPITSKEYYTRGSTGLLDAVGKAITEVKAHTSKKDAVLVFVNTDGEENSSKEYTKEEIKKLVKAQEKKGWKFIFIGAGIDAFRAGAGIGISIAGNASASGEGVGSTYYTASIITTSYREAVLGKLMKGESISTVTLDTDALKNLK